jgi:hypothetical protein
VPKFPRPSKKDDDGLDKVFKPDLGPTLSPRFVLALVLFFGGLAWVVFYYWGMRPEGGFFASVPVADQDGIGPNFLRELKDWNYAIGFGLSAFGLIISAHKSTPMGRGRGVVSGMLGCFIAGILWICVYYVTQTSTPPMDIPIITDLAQKNLIGGIALMAVGFTFATKWE